jgi:transposase
MKVPVDQILNLQGMKILDFQDVEDMGIIITTEKNVNYCICPAQKC